ncbi:MAG: hypothetical protein IKI87_09310 [Clostridiales bacterium]|nr:hypothetical protein [Clostridiales bacterium]
MGGLLQSIADWLKALLIDGIMGNLSTMFDSVNQEVGVIAAEVEKTPAGFNPGVFSLIRGISESVILPIAGIILTFVCCWELIQMLIEHNNLANFDIGLIFKWIFKTFIAVTLVSNTFNITMAVFDLAHNVIASAGGIIQGSTAIPAADLVALRESLEAMELGPLIGLFFEMFIVNITMGILTICIFIVIYGRMIEIYLMTSLAPIPFATFGNREQSQIGQNYLRSLFALGFQGFLILVCVAIYAVLVQNVAVTNDIFGSILAILGYTVLLCFTLFKTGSLSKTVFSAH